SPRESECIRLDMCEILWLSTAQGTQKRVHGCKAEFGADLTLLIFRQDPEVHRQRPPFRLSAQLLQRAGAQRIDTPGRFAQQLADRGLVEPIDILEPKRRELLASARMLAQELAG